MTERFHPVASLSALRHDRGTRVKTGDLELLLLRRGDGVVAFQADCPHAGAPLEKGAVCNGRLVCPWHKGTFDADDGTLCEPPPLDALRRYPVRVEGDRVSVDTTPLARPAAAGADDPRAFAIVGAGAAGTAAAAALREFGFGGRLLLIDGEAAAPYDRTALSKFVLAGQMPVDEVPPLRDADWFERQRIERLVGRVERLLPEERRLQLDDGQELRFDAALLASGGLPVRPPLPGRELPGVHLLRSLEDAAALLADARPGARALILGDSFIGLESASALRTRGLEVAVVAPHPVPFAPLFGERIGAALRRLHEAHGVRFHQGRAARLEGNGRVRAAQLEDGTRLAADLVLIGTGIRPATGYLLGVPLADDGAVPVDRQFRARPALWAVGDIALFPCRSGPTRIEHWRLAQQQARVAARSMLGGQEGYADVPYFWTYHHDKRIDCLGHAERWDAWVEDGDIDGFAFAALQVADGWVQGAIGCQRERTLAVLSQRMREPLAVDEAREILRQVRD